MAKLPCYVNQLRHNPISKGMYSTINQWMYNNAISKGASIGQAIEAANTYFFSGQARPKWIEAVIPRGIAKQMWDAQYDQRLAMATNQFLQQYHGSSKFNRIASWIMMAPRAEKVIGHFGVFMSSHAGDLAYRPDQWGVFFRGQLRQVSSATSRARTERALDFMERDKGYSLALKGGLEVRTDITAGGFLGGHLKGPSLRAWLGGLTVARFEMWKNLMNRWYKPGLTDDQVLDLSTRMAEIANHATGSAKGPLQRLGSNVLFGPSLTQSKVSRWTADPVKTINTFANWGSAGYAERAQAWERLAGATQYLVAKYGALQINQGLLIATGSDQKVNKENPLADDYMKFKGFGLEGKYGASDPELRLIGSIIRASYLDKNQLAAETYQDAIKIRTGVSRTQVIGDLVKQYGFSKLQPAFELARTGITRETWIGQPIGSPLTPTQPSPERKGISFGEWSLSQLPIIATGPAKYVYDQLTGEGLPASEAMMVVKGLAVAATGFLGSHVAEEKEHPAYALPGGVSQPGLKSPPHPKGPPRMGKPSRIAIPTRY